VSSTYLKKSIATIVSFAALGLSMEAGAIGHNNSSTGPGDLDTETIYAWRLSTDGTSPYDVAGGYVSIDHSIYDGDHWWDEGCGGACGGGGEEGASCPALRAEKPTGCDGYQHLFGAEWGRSKFPSNSGLGLLLNLLLPGGATLFSPPYNLQPQPWNMIHDALYRHTDRIAVTTTFSSDANGELIDRVLESCDRQAQLTGDAAACYGALRVLVSESNGTSDAARTRLENIGYLPNFVVNFLAPENSLGIKYRTMNDQAVCNAWHQVMVSHDC
jgi:hypothetical protein